MLTHSKAEIERSYKLLYGGKHQRAKSPPERTPADDAPTGDARLITLLLLRAGFSSVEARRYKLRAAVLLAALAGLAVFGLGGRCLFVIPAALLLEYLRLKNLAYRRTESFEKDYAALLVSLSSGVRTGLDPLAALNECAGLFPDASYVKKEIDRLNACIERGLSEEAALQRFADSIDHPDVKLFKTSFLLARKEGSSLSHCLQRLSRVTRTRQSFRRKIRAAVAMQKLSAVGIAGCAVVIALIQALTNLQALKDALAHPVGSKALTLGLSLIVIGIAWMLHLTRTRI